MEIAKDLTSNRDRRRTYVTMFGSHMFKIMWKEETAKYSLTDLREPRYMLQPL